MTEAQTFRRGDVLLAELPFITTPTEQKLRPALVIQNDVGNRFSPNLIVASISSQLPRRRYPTNVLLRRDSPEAEGSGLDLDSVVQAEAILTISKGAVQRPLGRLNEQAMQAVDDCLRVSLAIPQ